MVDEVQLTWLILFSHTINVRVCFSPAPECVDADSWNRAGAAAAAAAATVVFDS